MILSTFVIHVSRMEMYFKNNDKVAWKCRMKVKWKNENEAWKFIMQILYKNVSWKWKMNKLHENLSCKFSTKM